MKKIFSFITGINLITIIVILNFLLTLLPKIQIDLTANKLHSLAPTSKNIVRSLDDVVNIKVFITTDLPTEIKPIAADLKLILKNLEQINRAKLKVSFLDPAKDEQAKNDVQKYGIQTLQFSSIKSDKFEVQNGYLGLVMIYANKQEVLPIVNDVGNLEYFVISGIKKLTSKQLNKVAVIEDNPNNSGSNIQYLRKYLSQTYDVVNASLDDGSSLPQDVSTLVIVGRSKSVPISGINELKNWVNNGKGLIAFIDRIAVGQNIQANKIEKTGLEDLFTGAGMKIEDKLIIDENSAIANFNTKNGAFIVKYPYWLQIRPENIDGKLPVMSGINSLLLAWASPISIEGQVKVLFTSSTKSGIDENFSDLSPLAKNDTKVSNDQKYITGAVRTDGIKVALIADADMIKDQFIVNNQQNLILGLNLVDYFSQDASLLTIRSKTLKINPLKIISENTKGLIRVVNLVIPMIVLLVTFFIWQLVRKKQSRNWYEPKEI